MAARQLIRITTTYFCAGLVAENGIVILSAPILSWTRGKKLADVEKYWRGRKEFIEWGDLNESLIKPGTTGPVLS